jgi:hypothetical protein
VSVEADYREPIALVRCVGGYRLVDRQGVCLPGLYTSNQVRQIDLPWVTGVGAAAPEVGAIWPGDDLAAGLSLVRRLAAEPYARQILRYDVSQRDEADRIRLTLHTAGGAVRWGLPPGQEQAIEEDAAVKVRRLRELVEAYGSINAGRQVVEIYGPWSPLDASERLARGNLGR